MYPESDLLPLSGLQHLVFCERQWALIHIEQQWEENRLTAEGRLLHAKADEGPAETRAGVRIVRALPIHSRRLGLVGLADVVEFPLNGAPPVPVEYKRGRAKRDGSDEVQLCAQALCLEEMLGIDVPEGCLFYAAPRRRLIVPIDAELRERTEHLAGRMHALYSQRATPAPRLDKRCRACSLLQVCQPAALSSRGSARTFLRRALFANLSDPLEHHDNPTTES